MHSIIRAYIPASVNLFEYGGLLRVSLAFQLKILCSRGIRRKLQLKKGLYVTPDFKSTAVLCNLVFYLLSCYRIDKDPSVCKCMVIHGHLWDSDASVYKWIVELALRDSC